MRFKNIKSDVSNVYMNLKLFVIVGGALGIAFAASGLSQVLIRDNRRFEIYPNGTTPIAAFLTNATERMPEVNATSATFAETNLGNQQYNHSTQIEMSVFILLFLDYAIVTYSILFIFQAPLNDKKDH